MRRTHDDDAFRAWFDRFLPDLAAGEPRSLFTPATVSDRSDGKIAHLDGLNLSRAWCWRQLASALDSGAGRARPAHRRRASRRQPPACRGRLYGRALARDLRPAGAGGHEHAQLTAGEIALLEEAFGRTGWITTGSGFASAMAQRRCDRRLPQRQHRDHPSPEHLFPNPLQRRLFEGRRLRPVALPPRNDPHLAICGAWRAALPGPLRPRSRRLPLQRARHVRL